MPTLAMTGLSQRVKRLIGSCAAWWRRGSQQPRCERFQEIVRPCCYGFHPSASADHLAGKCAHVFVLVGPSRKTDDSRAALSAVFPESVGSIVVDPPEGLHCFSELIGCWLVLGCDSQSGDPNDPASEGDMSATQLTWMHNVVSMQAHKATRPPLARMPDPLEAALFYCAVCSWQLNAHPDTPSIICLHHPPVEGTESFTNSGAKAIEALVAANAQVKAVLAGHIHNDFDSKLGDVPLLVTPSCVFQCARPTSGQSACNCA